MLKERRFGLPYVGARLDKEEFKEEAMDPLLQQLLSGLINLGMNALGNLIDTGIDNLKGNWAANAAGNQVRDNAAAELMGVPINKMTPEQKQMFAAGLGTTVDKLPTGPAGDVTGSTYFASQRGMNASQGPAVVSQGIEKKVDPNNENNKEHRIAVLLRLLTKSISSTR